MSESVNANERKCQRKEKKIHSDVIAQVILGSSHEDNIYRVSQLCGETQGVLSLWKPGTSKLNSIWRRFLLTIRFAGEHSLVDSNGRGQPTHALRKS